MSFQMTSPLMTLAPRRRSLRFATTCGALALLAAVVPLIPNAGVIALSAIMLGAFVAYLRFRGSGGPIEIFEIIIPFSVLYIICFGVGTVYLVFQPGALAYPDMRPFITVALAIAVAGYVAFLGGYALWSPRLRPTALTHLVPRQILAYLIPALLGAAGYAGSRFQSANLLSGVGISPALSLLQQFGSLFFFGWYLAWYMTWAGALRASRAIALLAVLTCIVGVVVFVSFGSKAMAMTVLGMPVMAYYETKRRLPIKTMLAVALVTTFVVFPMFNTFRQTDRSLDTSRRLDHTLEMASGWDSNRFLDASVFAALQRVALVTAVAAVVSDTPRWVDYRYGDTLFLAPVGLMIPRFLWPEKPNISIGREFGATFHLTRALDTETEVAPTMVGELYWNFALPGVVIGMFILGIGYRYMFARFGAGTGFAPVPKAIYAAILPTLLQFEGNVAIIAAGVVKSVLIIAVFLLVMRRVGLFTTRAPA